MAIVVVLVGQCGNQFGDELFTQLALCTNLASTTSSSAPSVNNGGASTSTSNLNASTAAGTKAGASPPFTSSPFFTRDGMARCVLVDTEPKVVLGVRQRHANFMRPDNVVHGQSGRGNNWGLGYHGVKTAHSRRNEDNAAVQRAFRNMARDQREEDDNVLGRALQAIYRETRRTSDAEDGSGGFEALVIVHSLVGGTGSGLASRLTERLRLYFTEPPPGQTVDEVYEATMMRIDGFDGGLYGAQRRARHLVNIAVAPQVVGEVATQGLNACLTLQVLQKHADAVLLLRNDDAMAPGEAKGGSVCAGTSVLTRCVTFKEANEVLVALLLPLLSYGLEPGCITHLLMQCIPPAYVHTTGGNKILTLLPTPQRSYAVLRQCVHRALFCAIEGGRAFMPGYKPTVPVDEMLSRTAQQLWASQPRRASTGNSSRAGRVASRAATSATASKAKPTLSASSARGGGTVQRRGQATPSSASCKQSTTLTTQRMRFEGNERDDALRDSHNSNAQLRGRGVGGGGGGGLRYRSEEDEREEEDLYEAQRRLSGRQRQNRGFRTADDGRASRPAPPSAGGPFASATTSNTAGSALGASGSSRRRPPPVTPFSSTPSTSRPTRVQPRPQPVPARTTTAAAATAAGARRTGYREMEKDIEDDNDDLSYEVEDYFQRHEGRDESDRDGRFYSGSLEDSQRATEEREEEEEEDDLNRRVFQRRTTSIPAALFRHYQSLRRAPVTKMFETIDGVLLMNEAVELDRSVLFPLLRSAALKVSTGAFMSSYEDVGVTAERVKRAIRDVAEVMANSEEV